MTNRQLVNAGTTAAIGAFVLTAFMLGMPRVAAHDDDHDGDSRVRRGFEIAPVKLNLHRKNRELVGLGSYIVNAVSECNGCHSQGPQTEFTPTGNPYLLSPPFSGKEQINPATYLGGGRDFGPFPGPTSPIHIVSRNLTPDKTGLPIGGDTFEEFRHTIRTGVDPDQLHPMLPPPFNGALLQIMPWPAYQHMTDHDLRAIYEYLSAIPCVASPGHDCA
jgi:hypothetical protein